jgi:hypothetical protein
VSETSQAWLLTALSFSNAALAGVGIYLAHNLRRQLQLKIVDHRLNSYTLLWSLMERAGPWRIESGLRPISAEERKELYDNMTSWYYGSGNGMLLAPLTREIYLNAKFNLICPDERLRPHSLIDFLSNDMDHERWRGSLSMSQLSMLRAQMRTDLAIYGLLYEATDPQDREFLMEAKADLRKPPWRQPRRPPWKRRVRAAPTPAFHDHTRVYDNHMRRRNGCLKHGPPRALG